MEPCHSLLAKKIEINGEESDDVVCVKADISNVGKAIALNVGVTFKDDKTGENIAELNHVISNINPGEMERDLHIHIEHDMFKNIKFENQDGKMVAYLDCLMHFHDIYNRCFEVTQTFCYEKESKKFVPVGAPISFNAIGS